MIYNGVLLTIEIGVEVTHAKGDLRMTSISHAEVMQKS